MPDQPAARRGRRNPALLQPDGEAGPTIDPTEHDDPTEVTSEPDENNYDLLDEGDPITLSFTMPVILEGHSKETYIGSKVTVRVREDEDPRDASARARAFNLGSVLEQIDEAEEALRRYSEIQAERLARAGLPRQ